MKKIISLILALLIISFVSCAKSNTEQSQSTDSSSLGSSSDDSDTTEDSDNTSSSPSDEDSDTTDNTDETAVELILGENGSSTATIIYPEGNTVLSELASKLQMDIMRQFGIYVDCKKDTAVEYDENSIEILLGKTNRPESNEAYLELTGPADYVCRLYTNKIVITGMNATAVTSGYNYFAVKSINSAKSNETFVYSNEYDLFFPGAYNCPLKTCAGNPLESYKIVYPKDSINGEYYAATTIKHHLYYKVGLDLEVIDDSTPADGYEIIIGQTNRGLTPITPQGEYELSVKNGNLCISAGDIYGYEMAATYFAKKLFVNKISEDTLSSDFSASGKCNYVPQSNSEYRIMFNNCFGIGNNVTEFIANRDENAVALYLSYAPDVIGINEYWPAIRESGAIKDILESNGYKEVEIPDYNRKDGNVMPVFYKESSVKVLYATYTHYQWYYTDSAYESGTLSEADASKGVTTVVFESIETGERFIVCNTHFSADYNVSHQVAIVNRKIHIATCLKVLEEVTALYPDIPVFLGCDYNAEIDTEECLILLDAGFKDCHAEASTIRGNDGASCHGAPTYVKELEFYIAGYYTTDSNYKASIDHIFVLDNLDTVSVDVYETILTAQSASFSDHAPILIEFNINQ